MKSLFGSIFTISISTMLLCLVGCRGSENSPSQTSGSLNPSLPLSVSSIDALFTQGNGDDSTASRKQLFALKSSGDVQELQAFMDVGVNHDLKDFMVFSKVIALRFKQGSPCGLVVVRKSDSALVCVEKGYIRENLSEDQEGNVYFQDPFTLHVYKANFSDPGHIKKYQITTDQEARDVWKFSVDSFGDVFLYGPGFTRLALANGQSMNFGVDAGLVFSNIFKPSEVFSISGRGVDVLSRNSRGKFDIEPFPHFSTGGNIKEVCYTRNDIFGVDPGSQDSFYLYRFLKNPIAIGLRVEGFGDIIKASIECMSKVRISMAVG